MGCHIRVQDLTLTYNWKTFEKKIFQRLNLCIEPGSFVTVTGSNGCGKSSLIKLILGLVSPDHGQVTLDGEPVIPGYPDAIRKQRIAYLAQQIEELFYTDSVREELSYGLVNPVEQSEQVQRDLGLDRLLDRSIESLSGGERQSVALAQFMVQQAPLLILDEPSSYLDQGRATLLKNYLLKARSKGKTILHVTQYPAEISWGTHVIDLDQAIPGVNPL